MRPEPDGHFITSRDWWNDPRPVSSKEKDRCLVVHLKTPNGLLKLVDGIKNGSIDLPMPDTTKRSTKEMASYWPSIGWVAIWRSLDEEEASMMELTISQLGIQEVGVFKMGKINFLDEMKSNALYGLIESTLVEATRFVHLVGVGKHPACLARQLKPGDQVVFDRGVKGVLKSTEETTPAFLTLTVQVGKTVEQIKVRKDKLVGVVRQKRQHPAGPAPLPSPPPVAPALPPL